MPRKELPPRIKLENGNYYVAFSENGRSQRASLRTADFLQAQGRFQGWLEAREKYQVAQKTPTFEFAWQLYTEQHVERRTAAPRHIHFIGVQLNWYFGNMRMENITSKEIQAYTKTRLEGVPSQGRAPVAGSTIRKELGIMRAVFAFMVKRVEPKEMRMDHKQLCYIELPPMGKARQRVLSEEELDQVRALAKPAAKPARISRLHRFIWLLMETGSRAGALRELTWDQVDLEEGFLSLNPYGRTQTNKRRPTIPLTDALRPILERAFEERESEYVLDHPGQIRKTFEKFIEKHKLEDVTAHTFRHTFGTRLAQNGVSMVEIAALMGDQLVTVEKNYLHYRPEYLRGAINMLAARPKSVLEAAIPSLV